MRTDKFKITMKESYFPPEPVIVAEGGYRNTVFVTGPSRFAINDVAIAYGVSMFIVTDQYVVGDLFEDFQVLELRFIDNETGLMWNPGDYLEPGTELKLLASSHAEK